MYYPGVVAGKIKSFNYDHVGCYRYNLISDQTIFDPYFYYVRTIYMSTLVTL